MDAVVVDDTEQSLTDAGFATIGAEPSGSTP